MRRAALAAVGAARRWPAAPSDEPDAGASTPETAAATAELTPCPEQPAPARPPDGALPAWPSTASAAAPWTSARPRACRPLVNLWASWCAPCREELPLLQQLADDRRATRCGCVGVDSQDGRSQARLLRHGRRRHVPPRLRRRRRAGRGARPRGLPAHLFLAADGSRGARRDRSGIGSLDGAARPGRRAPRGAAVTARAGARADGLPEYLGRLLDQADDLPLRPPDAAAVAPRPAARRC